jgi:hypothetical protein
MNGEKIGDTSPDRELYIHVRAKEEGTVGLKERGLVKISQVDLLLFSDNSYKSLR